jgi:hypothetical protein
VYVSSSITGLYEFLSATKSPIKTMRPGEVVRLETPPPDKVKVATVTAVRTFHSERLSPDTVSPHGFGLHFEIEESPFGKMGLRRIAITGDTKFPSVGKPKAFLEKFTEKDVEAFEAEYNSGPLGGPKATRKRGEREIDILAMHIGSIERAMAELPDTNALQYVKNSVFYPRYHLGFAGCLKMLDWVFRSDQAGKVAILTEFGEELRGYRVNLARALERATNANPGQSVNVRVFPADIGMALELTWDNPEELQKRPTSDRHEGLSLRCSKCLRMQEARRSPRGDFSLMDRNLFHPISEMDVFEDLDTGLIQYCCGS